MAVEPAIEPVGGKTVEPVGKKPSGKPAPRAGKIRLSQSKDNELAPALLELEYRGLVRIDHIRTGRRGVIVHTDDACAVIKALVNGNLGNGTLVPGGYEDRCDSCGGESRESGGGREYGTGILDGMFAGEEVSGD